LFHRRDLLQWGVFAEQHDHGRVRRRVLLSRQCLLRNLLLPEHSGLLWRDVLRTRAGVLQWDVYRDDSTVQRGLLPSGSELLQRLLLQRHVLPDADRRHLLQHQLLYNHIRHAPGLLSKHSSHLQLRPRRLRLHLATGIDRRRLQRRGESPPRLLYLSRQSP